MIRLFANAGYDFIRWRRWAYGLTAALIIPGFALFLVHGLNYSIEFTGGTLVQVRTTQAVGTERIRGALDAAGIRDAEIQQFGGANEYKVQARLGTTAATTEVSTQATAQAVDSALAHGLGPDLRPAPSPGCSPQSWPPSSRGAPAPCTRWPPRIAGSRRPGYPRHRP